MNSRRAFGKEVQSRSAHTRRIAHNLGELKRHEFSRVDPSKRQSAQVNRVLELDWIGKESSRPPEVRVLDQILQDETYLAIAMPYLCNRPGTFRRQQLGGRGRTRSRKHAIAESPSVHRQRPQSDADGDLINSLSWSTNSA